jgi:hypothetical protein
VNHTSRPSGDQASPSALAQPDDRMLRTPARSIVTTSPRSSSRTECSMNATRRPSGEIRRFVGATTAPIGWPIGNSSRGPSGWNTTTANSRPSRVQSAASTSWRRCVVAPPLIAARDREPLMSRRTTSPASVTASSSRAGTPSARSSRLAMLVTCRAGVWPSQPVSMTAVPPGPKRAEDT